MTDHGQRTLWDEVMRWRAYDYTDAELLTALREPEERLFTVVDGDHPFWQVVGPDVDEAWVNGRLYVKPAAVEAAIMRIETGQ